MADTKTRIILTAENRAAGVINQLRGQLGSLSTQAATLNKSFGAFGAVLGGAVPVTIFAGFIRSTAQSIDKLNDLKDATGASIENLSALEDVGARTGTSFEAVSSSLVKFNKVLSDSKPDSDAGRIFKALGLSIKDLKAQDPAEALRLTAVALSNFADDGDKARAVQELFGKSVKDAAPFLNDLAKQTKLAATLTTEQAEATKRFNEKLLALSKNSADLSRTIAGGLIPVLNDYAAKLNQFLGGPKTKATLGTELELIYSQLQKLKGLRGQGFTIAGFFGSEAEREQEIVKLEERLKRAQIAFSGQAAGPGRRPANEGGGRFLPQLVAPGVDSKAGASAATRQNEAERYLETLQRQADKTRDLNSTEQALLDIQKGRIEGLTPRLRDQILAQAALNDTLGKTLEVESRAQDFRRSELGDGANTEQALNAARVQSYEDLKNAAASYFQATRTPQEKLIEDIKEQQRLLAVLGEQYADTFGRAAAQAVEKFQETQKVVEKTDSTAKDLGLTFSSAFENAIVGGKGLKDTLSGLEQDILRILARKLVTEPLANTVTGALGSLGSAFGFARGGAFEAGLQRFAAGGVVNSPTLFRFAQGGSFRAGLMGEAGPEAILPLTRGAGGKLGVQAEAAPQQRAVTVTINQQFAAGTDRSTLSQAAAKAAAALQRAAARGF